MNRRKFWQSAILASVAMPLAAVAASTRAALYKSRNAVAATVTRPTCASRASRSMSRKSIISPRSAARPASPQDYRAATRRS